MKRKIETFFSVNREVITACLIFMFVLLLTNDVSAYQLTPQDNPFGTQGDQAIGGWMSGVLTLVNALTFFGGILFIFYTVFKVGTGQQFLYPLLGAVLGLGGWSICRGR